MINFQDAYYSTIRTPTQTRAISISINIIIATPTLSYSTGLPYSQSLKYTHAQSFIEFSSDLVYTRANVSGFGTFSERFGTADSFCRVSLPEILILHFSQMVSASRLDLGWLPYNTSHEIPFSKIYSV